MKGFYERVNPLTDIVKVQDSFELDFQRQWRSGVVRGWEKKLQTVEEIQTSALYCRVCTKLFQNDNTFVHHFAGKRHRMLAKAKEKEITVVL